MLTATGLVKVYGNVTALDGFDLAVDPGEITGLVGQNGAGKTTFLEIVSGLVRPDGGAVSVGGIDALAEPRAARRLTGTAPQDLALYLSATTRDNLRLFGALAGLRRAALGRAIEAVAEELRLTSVLDRQAGLLSGGQRHRTQAAAALIGDPPLLLLDEPTAGADPETRTALLSAVRARAAAGTAIVYTTHYLPELADLGATLAVARAGHVIARGSQDSLVKGLPGELRLRLSSRVTQLTGQPASQAGHEPVPGGPAAPHLVLPGQLAPRARLVDGELRITSTDPPADLAALLAAGCVPVAVDVRRPSLDDLYRSLAPQVRHVA